MTGSRRPELSFFAAFSVYRLPAHRTDLGDQGESQQTARGADGQQDQLASAALAQVREEIHERRHQALQTNKLEADDGKCETDSFLAGVTVLFLLL